MKNKITIGMFNDAFYPAIDGVVMVVDNLARGLSKKANVIVFVPDYKDMDYDDSVYPYKVVRVKSFKIPKTEYTLATPKIDHKFLKELDKCNLDIVHIHSPFTLGNIGIKYAKSKNIPVIATMHSQHKQDLRRETHSKLLADLGTKKLINIYEKCDECWAVNAGVAKLFHEEYGYKTIPKVITTATEMSPVKDITKAYETINNIHKLTKEDKVFLFVGRLFKVKNIFFLIDSISELEKRNVDFKYKIIFIGIGQDEKEFKRYIKSKHLEDKVILCGKVTDRTLLSYYYARADLFLFPSMYDTNSLVQKEAASQKTPTIFLENAITAYDITNNQNGFIVPADPKKYAEKIDEVMHDKKLYDKVSHNAFKEVYKTWDNITTETYNRYLELINK